MRKFNCALLIDDSISSNFLNYRLLKKLNVADNIQMEKNTIRAMQFLHHFLNSTNNTSPELIIMNTGLAERIEFLNLFKRLSIANKNPVKIIVLSSIQLLKSFTIEEEHYQTLFLNKEKLLPELQSLLEDGITSCTK